MPNLDQDHLDRALEHLRQLPRAKPPADMLTRIEAGLDQPPTAKVIPLQEWRKLIAAALVILSLNATAMAYYVNQPADTAVSSGYAETTLISDYQLYD